MHRDSRLAVLALGAALVGLLLACAPGMEGFEAQPASWACPTPSPIPTRIIGYEPTPTPVPDVTPSGEVTMSVPRHAQSGQVARLKGKGVERKGQTGDLYVRFMIQLPSVDSPDLEDAVQKIDKAQSEDVRAKIRF